MINKFYQEVNQSINHINSKMICSMVMILNSVRILKWLEQQA